jgi:pyruvate, water dikinase
MKLVAAVLVLAAFAAEANAQSLFGSYELSGADRPANRPTKVQLHVEGSIGSATVTRTSTLAGKSHRWTSSHVSIQGRFMTVQYTVKGTGILDILDGISKHPNTFRATYVLAPNGRDLDETVRNLTFKSPHTDWSRIVTSGRRTLSPSSGTTYLPDMKAFDKIARRDDVPGAHGVREVKFLVTGVDGFTPQVYLIDTKKHVYHYDFYTKGLGKQISLEEFNRITYFTDARKNVAGTVIFHESYEWKNGAKGLFAVEFWPTDPVKVKHVAKAYHQLLLAMPFAAPRMAYHPAGETQERLYLEEKAAYDQAKVRVVTTADLFGNLTYAALNLGEGFGRLRVLEGSDPQPASVRDIVIFKQIPNDLSHTSGIITEQPQTPLSHVNLKAKQNKTPNAYIKNASTHPRIQPLLGKIVRFVVKPDDFEIREATAQEAETFLEALRPKTPSFPPRDLSEKEIRPLSELSHGTADRFGAKASNVAELRKIMPAGVVPDGFAIPFWFYDEHMKANGLYDKAKTMMADPQFQSDPAVREKKLKDFRKAIRAAPVPPVVAAKLKELHAKFPPGQPIRLRSSTNNEDLPNFNGAGLYDSKTHRPDEGALEETVKEVWSSLWNFRAFEERDFYRIDHATAAMGVLAHPNFDDEIANGVAITRNIFDPNWPGFYVNAQVGESLITNPDGSTPDEFLVSAIGPSGEYEVQYVQRSNQVAAGKTVLTSAQIGELVKALDKVQKHFKVVYEKQNDPKFAMDVEWKFDKDGKLVVKQARPVVE